MVWVSGIMAMYVSWEKMGWLSLTSVTVICTAVLDARPKKMDANRMNVKKEVLSSLGVPLS